MSSSPLASEIAASCLGMRTRMLDRAVTGVYDRHLREVGLRITQLTILTAIADHDELGPADLARGLVMDKSTVSRTIDRMIERGWLDASESADARSYRVRLTRSGTAKLTAAHPRWRAAQAEIEALLGAEGAGRLAELAAQVRPQHDAE